MNLKILITGSKGQLGNEIRLLEDSRPEWEFIYTDIEELDITNQKALRDFFTKFQPDVLVNCASYTAVDKAEENEELAEMINAKAVDYLAKACSDHQCFMVHVSTDFVFGGEKNTPYEESDFPNPLSAYARSKFHGEQAFMDHATHGVLMRTSWLYSSFGFNFVKTMMKLGQERDELGVVYDQVGTPTYARDLAKAILQMIDSKEKIKKTEIFHFSDEGIASWYDFAVSVMEIAALNCRVKPLLTFEYPLPAKRPAFSVMSKKKISEFLSVNIPHWRNSLEECIHKLKQM